ncbi:MAG TPA: N-acetyl-alpha-D-glucosaminyl L-malate synthase BshA [Longimicrobiaceae bacterium]|nr:N-acetyl-alpha-D-glucosaminyl L-malate synthase BshA [Longimicrobiaceae bacterium]
MKIGITCYPTYGGSGAIATELGMELARRGHEVHFISYAHPFRLPHFMERVFFHEVEVASYPLFEYAPYDLALAAMMHEVATRQKLDLLHVHYAIPHATSAWIAKEMLGARSDLKIITTLHGTDITLVGQERSFLEITKFSIARSDGLTAVSEYLKEETVRHFAVPGEKIHVVPNFVDPALYDRDRYPCRKSALTNEGEKLVMHISNFRPVKRVADVVRIFRGISAALPARLVFVGDGPERHTAADEATHLGIADRVLFLGKQDNVAELLACADLFLLPSASESFGLSALEAMSAGVPVVASASGGLPEVVESGITGFLAPVGQVDEMADAAIEVLGDPALWDRMSAAARERAVERFSIARVVPEYEDYYHEVLMQPTAAAGGEPSR